MSREYEQCVNFDQSVMWEPRYYVPCHITKPCPCPSFQPRKDIEGMVRLDHEGAN